MCGINGVFAYNVAASAPDRRELLATRDAMSRRGPDGFGEWWSSDRRLGFGHRRLALLDLSEAGAQPMTSADGRYVVTFNGEIYNYPELRDGLEREGVRFRSASDTEVLLVLYARDGSDMLGKLRGMFAFAIWDNVRRELFLARDPYGVKPLYISNDGWTFRFASQVRALLAGGYVSRAPEPAGVVGFHIWGSVPEPFTLYRDIEALPPGSTLLVTEAGQGRPRCFASISDGFAGGAHVLAPEHEIAERVRAGVRDSVRAHMLADADVGVFLSSGVDSGALLGLVAELGTKRPRAITLSFTEFLGSHEDETSLATEVARKYGAEHVLRTVSQDEFHCDLPLILEAMDQPSIDGINTWFVAKAAREAGLKAALSGIGGDELFAGYGSFVDIPRWVAWARFPGLIPGLGASARVLTHALGLGRSFPKLPALFEYGGSYAGAYLLRRALFLPFELDGLLDRDLVRQGLERLALMRRLKAADIGAASGSVARVGALESSFYLRNQLLRDADWAGMAHSVEIRTPLVDYRLLQTVAPIVPSLVRPHMGKMALASAPANALPRTVIDRAKSGFNVPLGRWLAEANAATRRSKGFASRTWGKQVFHDFARSAKPLRAAV